MLTIEIPPQLEARLREQAEALGKDVNAYVAHLVAHAAERATLEKLLAPLREQFAATGVSDEELVADVTDAQAEYRESKQKKTA